MSAGYSVALARSARKELEKLPSIVAERVLRQLESLAKNPHPPGALKLKGGDGLWRGRVGDYRIIYEVNVAESVVDISIIRHRRDVYRDR